MVRRIDAGGISTEELIKKLHLRSMSSDVNLAFLLGVAAGKLHYQQQRIIELESLLKSAAPELEKMLGINGGKT